MPTRKRRQGFLMDTHVWIWLINGDKRMGRGPLVRRLRGSSSSSFGVSVLSVWEVGMLEAKGRISLPYSCLEWIQKALKAPGIVLAPLTPEIAVESTRLSGSFPGDPADRILIATAQRNQAILVTMDKNILAYARSFSLPVLSP